MQDNQVIHILYVYIGMKLRVNQESHSVSAHAGTNGAEEIAVSTDIFNLD